jgi:hypothetical protein
MYFSFCFDRFMIHQIVIIPQDGDWLQPFGIRNFKIGRVRGRIGVMAQPPYVSELAFGTET